jgi:Mn-dependent DtxR family transcriptional regulator
MIGARREVVSGLLNRLRTDGLISYTRRGLIELDREALRAYIDSIAET